MRCAAILLCMSAWFFVVSVDELWYKYDSAPRSMGGWTHDGPYKTRALCEKARQERTWMHIDDAHWYRYKPGACREESAEVTRWRLAR
jgi:hypothetical protein